MASRLPVCCILNLWIILLVHLHLAAQGTIRLSKKQELGSNNNIVKTAMDGYNNVYECVDFYKQPALDHPELKNHSFHPEMRPTFVLRERTTGHQLPNVKQISIDSLKLKDGGCPQGTVPIRKMEQETLANFYKTKVLPNQVARSSKDNSDAILRPPGTYYALLETIYDPTQVYYGFKTSLIAYNPVVIENPQYSSAEIIIQDGTINSITVGWTVNPYIYKDNLTRFFVYTMMDGTPCFNSHCGFVSISKDLPPDLVIWPVSKRGGPYYEIEVAVYRDKWKGVWWLEVQNQVMGFWASKIFNVGLGESASYVACGGEVYFPQYYQGGKGPEMGSGYLPDNIFQDNAFCYKYHAMDKQLLPVELSPQNSIQFANNNYSYAVSQVPFGPGDLSHVVIFGGTNSL